MDMETPLLALLKKDLSNEERMQFDVQMCTQRKGPTIALILSILLGALGIDRFYIGDIGLGVGKLLTLGGLGIWALVDWFLIMSATRRRNMDVAQAIHDGIVHLR